MTVAERVLVVDGKMIGAEQAIQACPAPCHTTRMEVRASMANHNCRPLIPSEVDESVRHLFGYDHQQPMRRNRRTALAVPFRCRDCGSERMAFVAYIRDKIARASLEGRCRSCWKVNRVARRLYCSDCGVFLRRTSMSPTMRCWRCNLLSRSTKFKEPDVDDAFGHWLAGFVDGEGNFNVGINRTSLCGFAFRIILREDDKTILEQIRDRLGVGRLYYRDVKKAKWASSSPNTRNQWAYIVQNVVDLIRVVLPVFDKYPLRARKGDQYVAWRAKLISSRAYGVLVESEVPKCASAS